MTVSILSEEVINQIAAGEVIENPASVVKELVENAIDADAKRIEVTLNGGGLHLIRVSDDGLGMNRANAELALLRHATSKLHVLSDLDSLHTMGFRGEALAAIASVSELEILTAEENELATKIVSRGGRIERVEPSVRTRGTTIEVRSLFFNAPARFKFQKSASACSGAVAKLIQQIALAHPELTFCYGSNRFLASDWKVRISEIVEEQGRWFEEPDIKGFLGGDESAGRSKLFFYLNRRPIYSPLLIAALREGMGPYVSERSRPTAVLFLQLDPTEFDVNVHPQKREVRFRNEGALFCKVRNAIQRAYFSDSAPSIPKPSFSPPVPTACVRNEREVQALNIPFSSQENTPAPSHPPEWTSPSQWIIKEQEHPRLFSFRQERGLAMLDHLLLAEREGAVYLVDVQDSPETKPLPLQNPLTLRVSCAETVLERLSACGIEARQLGTSQLCFDVLPKWLDPKDLPCFIEELRNDVPVDEVIGTFMRFHPKKLKLEEAEELWKRGSVKKEVRLSARDLEHVLTR